MSFMPEDDVAFDLTLEDRVKGQSIVLEGLTVVIKGLNRGI